MLTHTHTVLRRTHSIHTPLRAAEILADPPLTDRQEDQSEVNDGVGGRGEWDGGVRDNNPMSDSIQVFGFARQPFRLLRWYQTTPLLLADSLLEVRQQAVEE